MPTASAALDRSSRHAAPPPLPGATCPAPARPPRSRLDRARDLAFRLHPRRADPTVARHRTLSPDGMARLSARLIERYFAADAAYLGSPAGAKDYWDHLVDRLGEDRRRVVPWLASLRPLAGLEILEIGSGTGASTVALAEQGARVTGIDIDGAALEVARTRCAAYGLGDVSLVAVNLVDLPERHTGRFDLAIFYASLEHMLHAERLEGLRRAWSALKPDGLMAIVECPNRLWLVDGHTSHLPFFHWLPDELALAYARHSPRASLRRTAGDGDPSRMLPFLRAGRGVSYHEVELALGGADAFRVAGCLDTFLIARFPLFYLRDRLGLDHRYRRLLARVAPEVDPAFLFPSLNLALARRQRRARIRPSSSHRRLHRRSRFIRQEVRGNAPSAPPQVLENTCEWPCWVRLEKRPLHRRALPSH